MANSGEAVTQTEGISEKAEQSSQYNDLKGDTRENSTQESVVDSSDEGDFKPQVNLLARALTHQSIKDAHGVHVNPFDGSNTNPLLDPLSDKFSSRAWARTVVGITSRDPERYPTRVAGIAYTNLSAHGFGEATDYQKTFGNYPLETGELFKRLIGRRQQTKIQILRHFDGLVRSGEMLVVLGRPGR
jgi:ATP-binding cassette subfamily G (WHITE) protein 2 (PDR)